MTQTLQLIIDVIDKALQDMRTAPAAQVMTTSEAGIVIKAVRYAVRYELTVYLPGRSHYDDFVIKGVKAHLESEQVRGKVTKSTWIKLDEKPAWAFTVEIRLTA